MKKLLLLIITILLLPFVVYAESCELDKVSISSIEIEEQSPNTIELEKASSSGTDLNFNVSMSSVGDSIKYKATIKNDSNEDFEIDEKSLNINTDYMNYKIETEDNSNIVKAKTSKKIYINLEYKNEVPEEKYTSGTFTENKVVSLSLNPDNPNTSAGTYIIIGVVALLASGILFIIFKNHKTPRYTAMFIIPLIAIPIIGKAVCKYEITINSNVQITKLAEFDAGPIVKAKMNELANHAKNIKSFKRSSTLPSEVKALVEEQIKEQPEVPVTQKELDNKFQAIWDDPNTLITTNFASQQSMISNPDGSYDLGQTTYCGIDQNKCLTREELINRLKNDFVYISKGEVTISYLVYVEELDDFQVLYEDDFKNVLKEKMSKERIRRPNILSSSKSQELIYGWYNEDDSTLYYYSPSENIYLNADASGMFDYLIELTTAPGLENINTINTTNTSFMFYKTGQKAKTFNTDLTNWNTSNVTNMYKMFYQTGYYATTWNIGDLTNWNISNVTTLKSMFEDAGYSATTFDIGKLSSWDVSKVTNMSKLFRETGYSATTFDIGNLDNWNISNVTNLEATFYAAGYNATTWNIGKLTNWDVSKVTDMSNMFNRSGYSTKTWNIGDLSNWDISNVTEIHNMFSLSGYNSTIWNIGDLSNWDVSNITNMTNMFSNSGYNSESWGVGDLSNWDTSKAEKMVGLFQYAGYKATTWESVGTIKIYANDFYWLFQGCPKAKATVNIYRKPNNFSLAFSNAATSSDANIIVNYSEEVTNINEIIATKTSNSHVVKGSLITS